MSMIAVAPQLRRVLLDDTGRGWDPAGGALAQSLDTHLRGNELVDYTIRNMGYLELASRKGSAHLRLRPTLVAQPALAAALLLLEEHAVERVFASVWNERWQDLLLPTAKFQSICLSSRHRLGRDDRREHAP
jgi:hypothetical protein